MTPSMPRILSENEDISVLYGCGNGLIEKECRIGHVLSFHSTSLSISDLYQFGYPLPAQVLVC